MIAILLHGFIRDYELLNKFLDTVNVKKYDVYIIFWDYVATLNKYNFKRDILKGQKVDINKIHIENVKYIEILDYKKHVKLIDNECNIRYVHKYQYYILLLVLQILHILIHFVELPFLV